MNTGKREWIFKKGDKPFKPGDKREMKSGEAERWKKLYHGEFDVIDNAPPAPSIDISADIKAMIKDIKGLGIKSAAKLFDEKAATTDEDQLAVLEEYIKENAPPENAEETDESDETTETD
jgi:hypothetical protein